MSNKIMDPFSCTTVEELRQCPDLDVWKDGNNLLHHAVLENLLGVARYLLEHNVSVDLQNIDSDYPIHLVKSVEMAELLVENGADVHMWDYCNRSVLYNAVKDDNIDLVTYFLGQGVELLDEILHQAKSKEMLELLVEHGCELDSIIHSVIENGCDLETVKWCAEFMDVNVCNDKNERPIYRAKSLDIVQFLEVPDDMELLKRAIDYKYPIDVIRYYAERIEIGEGILEKVRRMDVANVLLENGADVSVDKNEALYWAVTGDDLELAKFWIDRGADVNACVNYGSIVKSVESIGMIRLLVEHGAEISELPGRPVMKDNFELVRYFLSFKGCQVRASVFGGIYSVKMGELLVRYVDLDKLEDDFLHVIVEYVGSLDLIRWASRYVDVNATDDYGQTAIFQAKSVDACRLLVELGANLEITNDEDESPVEYAISDYSGNDVIRYFLDHGSIPSGEVFHRVHNVTIAKLLMEYDIEPVLDEDGKTVIMLAVENNFCDLVKFWLDNGHDIHQMDDEGKQAIHYVNSVKMVKLLVKYGADLRALDSDGQTVMHKVVSPKCAVSLGKYLIDYGVPVDVADNNGIRPIHLVRNIMVAKLLVRFGADVHARTNDGRGVFHIFNGKSSDKLIEYFLDLGVDPNIGFPLHQMIDEYAYKCARLLLLHGVNPNVVMDGKTPIEQNSSSKCYKLLLEFGAEIRSDKVGEKIMNAGIMSNDLDLVERMIRMGFKINPEYYGLSMCNVTTLKLLVCNGLNFSGLNFATSLLSSVIKSNYSFDKAIFLASVIDPNSFDIYGNPLWFAITNIKMLRTVVRYVNLKKRNKYGYTVLEHHIRTMKEQDQIRNKDLFFFLFDAGVPNRQNNEHLVVLSDRRWRVFQMVKWVQEGKEIPDPDINRLAKLLGKCPDWMVKMILVYC